MIIRQSDPQDTARLIKMRYDFSLEGKELAPSLFDTFEKECRLFFEEMYKSNRWVVWVAEVEGIIVSHVFLEIIDTVPRPGRKKSPYGYITNVYTVPDYRSKGIGSKIMEAINVWAKENELTFLMVWPSETSVKFYERHGFKLADEVMENHLKT